ncbi:hypothetical protein ACH5RR_010844 [Cinchona calisaya]|uniref:Uncharacterized protein n=1 Tax=Cinchona calisaya TaxID=153742 RepID=A0ABD3AK22_9GENT
MGRAPCCEKVGLKRGRWTAEEDEILTNYIQANGEGAWRSLPKNAGLLRCGKSCRLRWINYLRSDLKRGNISAEEEEIIINLHASLGNKWSLIAGQLPGRTDNEIKNYWNSHLSRKLHCFKRSDQNDNTVPAASTATLTLMDSVKPRAVVKKRKGSRTSRSNPKKNKRSIIIPSQSKEETAAGGPVNATVLVQMPRTPTLEKESTLSSAISWEEENICNKVIIMDDDDYYGDPCSKEEERIENSANTPPPPEDDGETKRNTSEQDPAVIYPAEAEFTSGNLMAATCDGVVGPDNGILCVDGVMGEAELGDPDGIFTEPYEILVGGSEADYKRESGSGNTNMDMDPAGCRSNGDRQDPENGKSEMTKGSGDWSVADNEGKLYEWDDWQWDEDVHNHNISTLGETADMLSSCSWLWDSPDNNIINNNIGDYEDGPGVEFQDDKHNALLAWLLS